MITIIIYTLLSQFQYKFQIFHFVTHVTDEIYSGRYTDIRKSNVEGRNKKNDYYQKNLERQHQDIYNIINETKSMINGADLEGNSANIARNISVLAGKLKIHLSNEDKYLYPSLIKKRGYIFAK